MSTRGKFPGALRRGHSDKGRQAWHVSGAFDGEAVSEEAVERDVELGAGLHQAEHDVAGDHAGLADGTAGYLALGDDGADVVFRAVGVQWDLGALQHAQEIGLLSMQSAQQTIEQSVSGGFGEDAIEPGSEHAGAFGVRGALVGLQVAIEPPDQAATDLNRPTAQENRQGGEVA